MAGPAALPSYYRDELQRACQGELSVNSRNGDPRRTKNPTGELWSALQINTGMPLTDNGLSREDRITNLAQLQQLPVAILPQE